MEKNKSLFNPKKMLTLALCMIIFLSGCSKNSAIESAQADINETNLPINEGFNLYSGVELGYSFLYPSDRLISYSEEDGVYIYNSTEENPPYVLIDRIKKSNMTPEKYFNSFTKQMLETYDSVSSTKIYSVLVGEKTLYMVRYICESYDKSIVVDRYLEIYDKFYIQYTAVSNTQDVMNTELYYAIYTLRVNSDAYAGSYSDEVTLHNNIENGMEINIPDMLTTNELTVGFFSYGPDSRFLSIICNTDELNNPIKNRDEFIEKAKASPTFTANQLGADSVVFTNGSERLIDNINFYCYPMEMTSGTVKYDGMLCLANADGGGVYIICYGVRKDCFDHDKIIDLLDDCTMTFDITKKR